MKRHAIHCCVVVLTLLLCGCISNSEQHGEGDGVALVREVMIEAAKSGEGQNPIESESAVRAVRDWRGSSQQEGTEG